MRISTLFLASIIAVAGTACVHTPPGTSVELALAKKAELIRMPAPAVVATATAPKSNPVASSGAATSAPDKTELVADAYSRGEFCMNAGKDAEAIAAFNDAVKVDPSFSEAWNKLAALYEKNGQDKLAIDAFKKSKMSPPRSASIAN